MALQGHDLAIFHARAGGLVHTHVACIVQVGFDAFLFGPVEQELLYLLEVARRTGYLCQEVEVFPNGLGLKISDFTHIFYLLGIIFN